MPDSALLNDSKTRALLDERFHAEVVRYFILQTGKDAAHVERMIIECLRYLYLISKYPSQLGGSFLPVEQIIDEVWHYLILQTREYSVLCQQRLPGGFFIHHRSTPYGVYQQQPSRKQLIEESLRWIPLYQTEFGSFDETALLYWTMARFLHKKMNMPLQAIAILKMPAEGSVAITG